MSPGLMNTAISGGIFFLRDQIVDDVEHGMVGALDGSAAVLEDHKRRGCVGVVCGGHIDPSIFAFHPLVNLAGV